MSRTLEKITIILLGIFLLAGPSLGRAEDEFSDTLSTDQLYKFGMEAAHNKGWARARAALEKWLKREKPTTEVLNTLGRAQLSAKDEKDAEKSFRAALGIDKKDLKALEGLCEVHLIRNKDKDMSATLKQLKAVDQEGRSYSYYQALAADRFNLKDFPETHFWDTLEELVRSDPEDQQKMNVLCDAYINDNFLERGILFLTEMQESHGDRPQYLFQLARIYTHSGDKELAREMFHKIADAGIDKLTARERFLMSKELFRLEEGSLGCEAYFSAARDMDDAVAEEVFEDLKDLTTSDEKKEFQYTPTGRKGIFIISFWGRKDPTPTTLKNERLAEHYKRIDVAHEKYYSPLKPGYDERGRVFIKHGEPDQKISLSGNWAIRDNETWLYSKNRSNPLIYHFVARNNFYRMAYSLEEALIPDLQSEINMGGHNIEALLRSRGEIDAKYDQLANELHNFQGNVADARRGSMLDLFHDEQMLVERGLTEGEMTETFEYKFEEEPMNFYYYPVSLKGSDSTSAVGVYFALPTDQVKVPDPFGTVEVPVRLEVVAYDSWWQERGRVSQDKTYRVPNFVASRESMIPDLVSLSLPPGNYHLAALLKQTRSNLMQIYKSNFFVHSYASPDSFYVSDMILAADIAEDRAPSKFNLRGYRIAPMPSASFKQSTPIYVYYELYNLKPDSANTKHVKVDYLVSSTGGDLNIARKIISTLGRFIGVRNEIGKVVTTFERDLETRGNIDPVYLSLDPAGYPPGSYNLMVTVEDTVSHQIASKDVTFLITK